MVDVNNDEGKVEGFDPSGGTSGKLRSNTTGEDITGVYDYGRQSVEDKETAAEIIDYITDNSQVPVEMLCELLRQRFHLREIPMRSIEHSIWHEFTNDERLGQSIQGFRQTGDGVDARRTPHVGFSADLDYLDDFIMRLINKLQGIDVEEINNRKKAYQEM